MMKRVFAVAMAACLLMLPMAVRADVVFGNEFLYAHEEEAIPTGTGYGSKQFLVNSPEGFVIPKEEPGSETGASTALSYRGAGWSGHDADAPYTYSGDVYIFDNGEVVNITHTYLHEGRYWGVMADSHTYQRPGWIPMDELLILYDAQDFEAAYADSFYPDDDSHAAALAVRNLVIWDWPGAPTKKKIVDYSSSGRTKIRSVYKDDDGRKWGKLDYSEDWVCLSDPENRDIPPLDLIGHMAAWSPDGGYDWSAAVTVYPPAGVSSSPIPSANLSDIWSSDFPDSTDIQPLDSAGALGFPKWVFIPIVTLLGGIAVALVAAMVFRGRK